jgi:hypothetical protein
MTYATDHILAKLRAGQVITPADTVQTIETADEMTAYSDGLKARGALTADALQAIERRVKQMGWWK